MRQIMDMTRRTLLGAWAAGQLTMAGAADAAALDSLEQFIRQTRAGRAQFTQVVTPPMREGQVGRVRTSSGRFEFQRPGRFRFTYDRPFQQLIVADGTTLWLHDVDLNQVTARPQASALGSTPAALIAAAPDLRALQVDFTLQAQPDTDGLEWVSALPRNRDGALQSIRVGLRPGERGVELGALEIVDSFGQRSVLTFSRFEVNPALGSDRFQFQPPPGADLVRSK
jgi:outer membrane lipoprotein carrier protein